MSEIIIVGCGIGLILLVAVMFALIEEYKSCNHIWNEIDRLTGTNMFGCISTHVHLQCTKCGDVKKVIL